MVWNGSLEFLATCCDFPNPAYGSNDCDGNPCTNPTVGPCETYPPVAIFNGNCEYACDNGCSPCDGQAFGCSYFQINETFGPSPLITLTAGGPGGPGEPISSCYWAGEVIGLEVDAYRCCHDVTSCGAEIPEIFTFNFDIFAEVRFSPVYGGWHVILNVYGRPSAPGYGSRYFTLVLRPTVLQNDPNLCPDFNFAFNVVMYETLTSMGTPSGPDYGPLLLSGDPCNVGNTYNWFAPWPNIGFPPISAYDFGSVNFS